MCVLSVLIIVTNNSCIQLDDISEYGTFSFTTCNPSIFNVPFPWILENSLLPLRCWSSKIQAKMYHSLFLQILQYYIPALLLSSRSKCEFVMQHQSECLLSNECSLYTTDLFAVLWNCTTTAEIRGSGFLLILKILHTFQFQRHNKYMCRH